MIMKIKALSMIVLIGISASSTLIAREMYVFEEIDGNKNGSISMSEAKVRADLLNNFSEIDSDGNGSLSVDEYSTYMNKGVPPEDVEIPEPGAAPVY
jgi:hypothetical protein